MYVHGWAASRSHSCRHSLSMTVGGSEDEGGMSRTGTKERRRRRSYSSTTGSEQVRQPWITREA